MGNVAVGSLIKSKIVVVILSHGGWMASHKWESRASRRRRRPTCQAPWMIPANGTKPDRYESGDERRARVACAMRLCDYVIRSDGPVVWYLCQRTYHILRSLHLGASYTRPPAPVTRFFAIGRRLGYAYLVFLFFFSQIYLISAIPGSDLSI